MISLPILLMILGCGLVTWLPRILPFVFAKKLVFPEKVNRFLDFLPLCILTALLAQSLLQFRQGKLPLIKFPELLACLPALVVGYYTKDLMKIVVVGILSMAILRLF